MAATPSLLVKKSTPFIGRTQIWSSRYHFSGGTPANDAAWEAFADAVVAAEKAIYSSGHHIVEAVGYEAGATVSAWSKAYSVAGTITVGTGQPMPGDVAGLVRYSTTQFTLKHHPIYLFNYYHAALADPDDRDKLSANFKSALETYGTAWLAGFSDGTNTYVRAGPNGAVAQSRFVNQYLTHRDFPR